ncbi:hypothetical protein F0562_010320 [Nyssa sinensis]|uniref:Dynein light chain n=1 Tax=Nyssa sinensis TaxID=561372 RepID=A0A5J5A3P4_9ASTE|nr:hypothetical protein F0562_010320 [Nyssa sinensis]
MEKPKEWKKEKAVVQTSFQRRLAPTVDRSPEEEVKLAAIAISLNLRLRSADMPVNMQERALQFTRSLVDATTSNRPNPTLLARALKKEFDSLYGPAWHCVVGKSFGSFVTHSPGGFVYFLSRLALISPLQNRRSVWSRNHHTCKSRSHSNMALWQRTTHTYSSFSNLLLICKSNRALEIII